MADTDSRPGAMSLSDEKATPMRVYSSLREAEVAAARQYLAASGTARSKFVTRVERAPFGKGYVVRSVPASFVLNPHLRRLLRPRMS